MRSSSSWSFRKKALCRMHRMRCVLGFAIVCDFWINLCLEMHWICRMCLWTMWSNSLWFRMNRYFESDGCVVCWHGLDVAIVVISDSILFRKAECAYGVCHPIVLGIFRLYFGSFRLCFWFRSALKACRSIGAVTVMRSIVISGESLFCWIFWMCLWTVWLGLLWE